VTPSTPHRDVDLTGAFRLDLKTIALVVAVGASWYSQVGRIDSINQRMDLEAKARTEVQAAQRDAEKARADLAAQQQSSLAESLAKLEAQLKVTSMDVSDLRIANGKKGL